MLFSCMHAALYFVIRYFIFIIEYTHNDAIFHRVVMQLFIH